MALLFGSASVCLGAWSGRAKFQSAADQAGEVLGDMHTVFSDLESDIGDLGDDMAIYNASAFASDCTPASITTNLKSYVQSFNTGVVLMDGLTDGVAEDIKRAEEYFVDTVPGLIDMLLIAMVCAIWFLVLFSMIAIFTDSCK